jgi:phenylpropionate dioxygenase-like ring-hydroxylating dioxygenase large terminal subunit
MENTEEIWKDVPGYEEKYQASNLGRVRSLDRTFVRSNGWSMTRKGIVLKPTLGNNKYLSVGLGKESKDKLLVHRIIAKTFIETKNEKLHVDHINSIRTDNRVVNLQWVTQQENNAKQSYCKGADQHSSKLTIGDVRHIRDEFDRLSQKRVYGTYTKIAKGYGVDMVTIHDIINKRTWNHVR